MAKSKTDRRRSARTAPRGSRASSGGDVAQAPPAESRPPARARAKPTAEQLARRESMRRRLQLAELASRETLGRVAPPADPPRRRRDPVEDRLAALRVVDELSRRAGGIDAWASFDESVEKLAGELATRWRLDLAEAFGDEDREQLVADFVERQRPALLAEARIALHELTEWPGDNSPEGCLASIRRARAWFGDEPPREIRLAREGREILARLTAEAPRPAGADDLQLVKLCTYLAERPAGDRVKPSELRKRLPERWPWLAVTRGTIAGAIERSRRLGYLAPSEGKRGGAELTPKGRRFAATVGSET